MNKICNSLTVYASAITDSVSNLAQAPELTELFEELNQIDFDELTMTVQSIASLFDCR